MIRNYKHSQGMSQLLLVLVVLFILTLIALTYQIFTYVQIKTITNTENAQKSFFAVESAVYEVIQRYRDEGEWPLGETEFTIGDTDVWRRISRDEGTGEIIVEAEATTRGVKRSLVAQHDVGGEGSVEVDIVLAMDGSGSMSGIQISRAKEAAHEFIDRIEESGGGHRIGLIVYGSDIDAYGEPIPLQGKEDFDRIRGAIDEIEIRSDEGTNTARAYAAAKQILDGGRDNSHKAVVLYSDGVPRAAVDQACTPGELPCDGCFDPGSSYAPDNRGTCCSQSAIDHAAEIKDAGYTSVAIAFFHGGGDSGACPPPEQNEFGGLTLLRSSSEPPNRAYVNNADYKYFKDANVGNIVEIYGSLADDITTGSGAFFIREVEPES